MIIGIDLGTTFSAAAYVNADGKAEIITNRDGERTTPSVVMFEEGTVVVGEQAKENSVIAPLNVCQFVKRQMGRKAFSFEVTMTEKYTAEEISAMILKRIKEDAQDSLGEPVEGAVITVPAYFDEAQRKATQDAGEIAGLNVLGIINEPTAAALAYCHGKADADGNVMVFDLGGGTFDITVMRLSEGLQKVDILSTTGNKNLGGFDFDNAVMAKAIAEFEEKYELDLEDDDTACQDLRIKAENLKKALSSRPKASFSLVSEGKALKVEVTREEFEEMIHGQIVSMKASMEVAMEDAGLQWEDLSKVLLVGGSTRIPALQEMIRRVTGIEPSRELNPDEAVALGAAYHADMLHSRGTGGPQRSEKVIKVTDVIPHSLGVITHREDDNTPQASFILQRNTPLPAAGQENYRTMYENQTNILLQVIEGEDEDPDYDTLIGTCTLKLVPRPKGSPIRMVMECDENGIIHIRVIDGVDGHDLGEMHIAREANLTEDEVRAKREYMDEKNIE